MSKLSKALQAAAGNAAPQLAELYTLGEGTYGALGNLVNTVGVTTNSALDVNTPFYGPWAGVSRTTSQSAKVYFLIRNDGTLWVSGKAMSYAGVNLNADGTNLYALTQVGQNADWLNAKISVGSDFVVAVKADGTLWAWGENTKGQLGQDNTSRRLSPVQVGSDTTWVNAAAGIEFWVGVKSDGTLWSCGENLLGQLGLGDASSNHRSSPVQIGALTNWADVAVGDAHSHAIKTDGTLWSWGDNTVGQLGTTSAITIKRSSPVQVGALTNWSKIYAGQDNVYAIKTDGTLWAWGDNTFGQLGTNNRTSRSSPVQVGAQTYWDDVRIGGLTSFQFCSGKSVYYVGNQDELFSQFRRSSPVLIGSNIEMFTHVVQYFNIYYAKSNPQPYVRLMFAGTKVVPTGRGTAINGGATASYRFPVPTVTDPIPVDSTSNWLEAATGSFSLAAIREDGTLWVTGYNISGELGIGSRLPVSSPVQVGSDTTWIKVSGDSGSSNFSAVKTDGTLWSWGTNISGRLGVGDRVDRSSPTQVGALTDWANISVGRNHALALKTNGTLWSWGDGTYGQLGINVTKTARSSPVQVGALTTWASISAGNSLSAAIKTDGTLWTWGDNGNGGLGQNINIQLDRSSPVQVGSLTNWSKVSASAHILAVKTDGTLWSWGNAGSGQLGLNDTANRSSPVQIGSDTDWVDAVASGSKSYALKSDGSLYAFGAVTIGQTDIGASSSISFANVGSYEFSSPVQIGANKIWSKISNGAFIVKND